MLNGQQNSGGPTADCRGIRYPGIRVAIDGPAASGKSTVGRMAAQRLGLRFLDTGIMYRAVTWLALRRTVAVDDADAMAELARCYPITTGNGGGASTDAGGLSIAGQIPGSALWDAAVDAAVSAVSAAPGVRTELVRQQRAIGKAGGQAGGAVGGIVMVGRDIGSVVLPDAEVKLYITASAEERARRRLAQRRTADSDGDTGVAADADLSPDFDRVLADTRRRDRLDSGRAVAPLLIADGATVINTDGLSLDQSVAAVLDAVRAAVAASISESASKLTAAAGEG